MKPVRLIALPVIMITAISLNTSEASAGSTTGVLQRYSAGIEQVDTEALEAELTKAVSEYSRVDAEYSEKRSMIYTVELASKLIRDNIQANDVNAASVDAIRKEDYLRALVNVNADLEKIFEAEREYREAQSRLGSVLDISGILSSRLESLSIYGDYLPETDIEDVEQAISVLKAARDKLAGAKKLADIGATENLAYPVNHSVTVTSGFGLRNDPFGGGGKEFHYGLDLAAPAGSEVTSLFNGAVAMAGFNDSLGYYVLITHGKELQTLYAHLNEIRVKSSDTVKQRGVIGLMGSTGRSTGPHLHLGVYVNGQKVDPMKLFING